MMESNMEDSTVPFTIGHHQVDRPLPVTAEAIASAHASGYDILTSPITTSHFHSRVLGLLSQSLSESATARGDVTSSLNASPLLVSPLAPADTPLTPDETTSQTVGISASWIDLGSPDPIIADISRQVLQLELAYAAFCGLSYVIIPGPKVKDNDSGGSCVIQYARAILDALAQGPYITIYIWLPMIDHAENHKEQMGDLGAFVRSQYLDDGSESKKLDLFGTWQAWDIIRSVCRYSARLCVALSLPRLLPPTPIQSRWYSEPVRILTVGSEVFVKNPKGYPVLTKAHQALVFRFVQGKQPAAWFLLCDVGPVPASDTVLNPSDPDAFPSLAQASTVSQVKDPTPHLSYMRNLQTKGPGRSATDAFSAGYQDYLQSPLQPLAVNLESITYEVFEKDPVKYEWYERAIARALHDWVELGKPTSNPDGRVVVAVVGAGRGPLVTRALQASEAVGVEIDMWALEKNPNAFVLLQRNNETKWDRKVNLVKSDMRTWRGPTRPANAGPIRKSFNLDPDEDEDILEEEPGMDQQGPRSDSAFTGSSETDATHLLATGTNASVTYKIDVLISELLGSFADNELSPECLDGVQHLLNPTHGISIPASYTAHITPIGAPKLHADISLNLAHSTPNAAEIPYVVMFNAIDYLSTETAQTSPSSSSSSPPPPPSSTSSSSLPPNESKQPQTWSTTTPTHHQTQPYPSTTPIPTTSQPTPTIKTTWSFHHPNPTLPTLTSTQTNPTTTVTGTPSNAHNNRHSTHTFAVPNRGTCHGIAGYFESILYPGVELSTNPATMSHKSPDMISWFPIFFPLQTPLYCPDASTLQVQMWRRTDDRKVWYEWIASVFIDAPNPEQASTGKQRARTRKIRIGGSELHSSEKEGCLM